MLNKPRSRFSFNINFSMLVSNLFRIDPRKNEIIQPCVKLKHTVCSIVRKFCSKSKGVHLFQTSFSPYWQNNGISASRRAYIEVETREMSYQLQQQFFKKRKVKEVLEKYQSLAGTNLKYNTKKEKKIAK